MNEQNAAPVFEDPDALIAACVANRGFICGQFPADEDRRVLLASHEFGLNGAPIVLLYLARSLRRLGWQPVLISPMAGPLLEALIQESFPFLICPSGAINDVLPRAAGLFRFMVLNTLVFARAAAALNGSNTSVLWWLHEAEEIYHSDFAQSMPEHLFSNIKVYAVSPRSREHLLRHKPGYFAGILTYGIPDAAEKDAEPFPLSRNAEGKRIFALVGTLERRKGQDVLLNAVQLLPEEAVRQCFFVFVGPVFHSDIGDRVRTAASCQADRFQYISQLPMEKMPAFYNAVDCVVCASRDDPEPVTVVEGCQFSKLVICSEHTGMAALLERDHAGLVYGGDDPAALAQCIMQVLDQSAGDAAAMRERARSFYLSNFSIVSFERRLETEILPVLLGPDILNGKPEAEALLLHFAENSRQRLLQLDLNRKQELEKMAGMEQTIREKGARIEALEAQNQDLTETAETQQERIETLEAQNQELSETAATRQERIAQLEALNEDLAGTAETQRERIAQLEALNQDLSETAETRQERIETLEAQNQELSVTAEKRQTHIETLEAQNRYLGDSFDTITNAFFWKITKPARFTLDIMKWAARPHAEKGLVQKGLYSLRTNGLRVTWQKAMQKIYFGDSLAHIAKQTLFSEEELAQQRKHRFSQKVKFSIVVPLYNTPEHFLRAMIESVQAQTYAGWELCMADGSDAQHGEVTRICREYVRKDKRIRYRKLEKNLGISGNTNACLEMATGDYIGLFDHDDLLHPAALYEVMRTIENTGADFVYTDESTFHDTPEDAYLPHFKPDFAPDNLRANNYICHFTVFKRSLLDEVGRFDPACDGSQDHDMVLRLTEKAQRMAHIPEILYYWRAHKESVAGGNEAKPYVTQAGIRAVEKQLERLGLEGKVEPVRPGLTIYRTRYAVRGTPKVSILIPNYEHINDLRTCLNSIFKKTTWPNYEIVIVENNSTSRELFAYYESLQREHANVRVVTREGAFNYSAINNYGAQFCTGDYLLLLNNDIEVITPDWIEEMLMFAQREDVGAVGAMLYYPDRTIQHAGVCLGMGGVAGHYFHHVDQENLGYMGRLLYPQDMTAVTAACMLLCRDVWDKVGGLDEDWAVAFNDVDLCMRIRKAGYLIVWTPFAELIHYESKSRGTEDTPEKQKRFEGEVLRFQSRWAKELEAGDPYYNPNFTLDRSDFSVKPDVKQYDAR